MSDTLTTMKDWQDEAASHMPYPFTGSSSICESKSCKCRNGQDAENGWYPVVAEICDVKLRNIAQACLCFTINNGLDVAGHSNSVWCSLPGMRGMFDFVNYNIQLAHRRSVEDYVDDFITDIIQKNRTPALLWLNGLFIAALHSPVIATPTNESNITNSRKRVRI